MFKVAHYQSYKVTRVTRVARAKAAGRPLTVLQRGMIVMHEGRKFRVALVNECRARIVELRARVELVRYRSGKVRKVKVRAEYNISPNSEIEIVSW